MVYSDEYELNSLQGGAVFLVSIGGGLATLAPQPVQNWMYRRSVRSTRGEKPRPEARLYTAFFCCLDAACLDLCKCPLLEILSVILNGDADLDSLKRFAFTPTHPEISL